MLVSAPVVVLAGAAVSLTSRGGPFYVATRAGRFGRPFRMWKLRTMRLEATVGAVGPRVVTRGDHRITKIGHLLRRLHIDEIPQFWNVLRGDMALIGPRPEDPAFVDHSDPRQRRALTVRPGVSGPTQLQWSGREALRLAHSTATGDCEPGEIERIYRTDILPQKLASDAQYVETRSAPGDLRHLFRAALHVLGWRARQ